MDHPRKTSLDSPQDSLISPSTLQFARRRSTVSSMNFSQCSSPDRNVDSAACMTPYSELDTDMAEDHLPPTSGFMHHHHHHSQHHHADHQYPPQEPGCVIPKMEDMGFDFQFETAPPLDEESCAAFPNLDETKEQALLHLHTRPSSQEFSAGNSAGPRSTTSNTSTPRKAGRPRKLTLGSSSSTDLSSTTASAPPGKKTTRVRSKTGCGTCRRRKKKCDEAKPFCLNCEKNNVVCDGYEPKQTWTSGGRQRSLSAKSSTRPPSLQMTATPAELPLLIPGVDGAVDQRFFQNFLGQLGSSLCLPDERGVSPFLEFIVPMSMAHSGVMHSLLFLSGSCLAANEATASQEAEWAPRIEYHSSQAVRVLQTDLSASTMAPSHEGRRDGIKDESIAQTLLLCLQTVGSGDTTGSYRFHLNAMKEMLVRQCEDEQRRLSSSSAASALSSTSSSAASSSDSTGNQMEYTPALPPPTPTTQPRTTPFRSFILETLLYLDHSSVVTSAQHTLDQRNTDLMAFLLLDSSSSDETQTQTPPSADRWQSGHFLGILDGLFALMARTRRLRDRIRVSRASYRKSQGGGGEGAKRSSWPSVSAATAATTSASKNDPRSRVVSLSTPASPTIRQSFTFPQSNFHKQAAQQQQQHHQQQPASYWTDASITNEAFAIDSALRAWTPPVPASQTPDSSSSSSSTAAARYGAAMLYRQCAWLYLRRTVRESRADEEGRRGVEEGLGYLRAAMSGSSEGDESSTSSSSSSSSSTAMYPVLLLPLFLLGCAAFDPSQREQIREAFECLQRSRGMGNIRLTRRVVEEVWRLMDAAAAEGAGGEEEERSWDWEAVAVGKGWDFVVV